MKPANRSPLFGQLVLEPLHELNHPPRNAVPALDALRTCAVLFVVVGHAAAAYTSSAGRENAFAHLPWVRNGWIGVDLFFVLSGYLIGNQLWKELLSTHGIDFPRFFLRRSFRIWPLYYFF